MMPPVPKPCHQNDQRSSVAAKAKSIVHNKKVVKKIPNKYHDSCTHMYLHRLKLQSNGYNFTLHHLGVELKSYKGIPSSRSKMRQHYACISVMCVHRQKMQPSGYNFNSAPLRCRVQILLRAFPFVARTRGNIMQVYPHGLKLQFSGYNITPCQRSSKCAKIKSLTSKH